MKHAPETRRYDAVRWQKLCSYRCHESVRLWRDRLGIPTGQDYGSASNVRAFVPNPGRDARL